MSILNVHAQTNQRFLLPEIYGHKWGPKRGVVFQTQVLRHFHVLQSS